MNVVSNCENSFQEYTINYEDIGNIRSNVLSDHFDEYVLYMDHLPRLQKIAKINIIILSKL